jgi:peptidoglycan lytic transglycosylase
MLNVLVRTQGSLPWLAAFSCAVAALGAVAPRVPAQPASPPDASPAVDAEVGAEQTGIASWYGPWHHGRRTASGETFDMRKQTAAHPSLPLGSRVRVTNLDNGRSTVVRINDRGPVVPGRIIDLSRAAAARLNAIDTGVIPVHLEVVALPSSGEGAG